MKEISATDAAPGFSAMLDAVEHGGETFVVTRGGRGIARIEPGRRHIRSRRQVPLAAPPTRSNLARWPRRSASSGTGPGTNLALLSLDTTVLVATERNRKRLDGMVDDDDDVIAAITAAELLVGIHLADDAHRQGRAAFVEEVLDTIPTEDYDLDVARAHAELLAHTRSTGRPRAAYDLIIAATARSTARIVVSADATAFTDLPNVAHRP